jgi:hypothetical protein
VFVVLQAWPVLWGFTFCTQGACVVLMSMTTNEVLINLKHTPFIYEANAILN